jgi:glycosyltransferase involved in cell wall biosynthesis
MKSVTRSITIVIPVYNEKNTIKKIIDRVTQASTLGLKKEIIVVDDGSTDGTTKTLRSLKQKGLKILYHKRNKGKGAALRFGFKVATGDLVVVQDADLEYDPKDYSKIIRPFINENALVVYGSRELSGKNRHSSIIFHAGGRLVTNTANLLFGSHLTDVPTGYKAFRKEILQKIPLKCNKFEFCPEVTAHLLKNGVKIKEVPINYVARHRREGKKIRAKDGVEALYTLFKVKLTNQ